MTFAQFDQLKEEGTLLDNMSDSRKKRFMDAPEIYDKWALVKKWHHFGDLHARVNTIQTTCRYIFRNLCPEELKELYTFPVDFSFTTDTMIWMGIHVPFETLRWMYSFQRGALYHPIITRAAIRAGRKDVASYFINRAWKDLLNVFRKDAIKTDQPDLVNLIDANIAAWIVAAEEARKEEEERKELGRRLREISMKEKTRRRKEKTQSRKERRE